MKIFPLETLEMLLLILKHILYCFRTTKWDFFSSLVFRKSLPFNEQVEDLFARSKSSVGGQENVDVSGLNFAGIGLGQILH